MKYYVYSGGVKDAKGYYLGGVLEGTFTSEREAFFFAKDLQWKRKPDFIYTLREGEEVFAIIPTGNAELPYHVVDKATKGFCYGVCRSMEEAVEHKAWCEKHHTLGGKWMDDYYKQYDT